MELNCVIQKAAWSATSDEKPQAKYAEYPRKVKDQIKEKIKTMNMEEESA
jgi:hypothetical protein